MKNSFEVTLTVTGMMCQKNCATNVQKALMSVDGVISAIVSCNDGNAIVKGSAPVADLIEAVEFVGFEAKLFDEINAIPSYERSATRDANVEKADYVLLVKGMKCASKCPKSIVKLLTAVDGVMDVQVTFHDKMLRIWGFADLEPLLEALESSGYSAMLYDGTLSKQLLEPISNTSDAGMSSSSGRVYDEFSLFCLHVTGMSCASCQRNLEDALCKLRGVSSVKVSLLTQKVEVVAKTSACSTENVLECVHNLGYFGKMISMVPVGSIPDRIIEFQILNYRCHDNVETLEKQIMSLDGILKAKVNKNLMKVQVRVASSFGYNNDPSKVLNGSRDMITQLEKLGLECGLADNSSGDGVNEGSNELSSWRGLLLLSLLFGIPVTCLHLAQTFDPTIKRMMDKPVHDDYHVTIGQAIMLSLNFPMQFFVGYKYYRSAFYGALQGNFGMDCLVVTGTTITFVYSILQIGFAYATGIRAKHVFFEVSGMLLMFVTIGKFLEAFAKGKTFSSISSLLKLQPKKALLVANASLEALASHQLGLDVNSVKESILEIDIRLVQKGDILKILPGSRIPTDGYVLSGSTYVDESIITGESRPVSRGKNDFIFGSTLNQNGLLYIRASSVGEDSALAQIAKLVESAQMSKAPIQAYADRVARVFTPTILLLALAVFSIWSYLAYIHDIPRWWYEDEFGSPMLFAMLFSISVIVISCPCALGLATPTAIMVGTSVAAANGILIKGGPAFEEAQKITAIIFDKTGTLTEGKPVVTDEIVLELQSSGAVRQKQLQLLPLHSSPPSGKSTSSKLFDPSKDYLLQLASTAELGSEHPIARAILQAASVRNLSPLQVRDNSFKMIAGCGISCETNEGTIAVGNRLFMDQNGVMTGQRVDSAMWDLEVQGKTAVCVALNNQFMGILGISDKAKPEAFATLATLFSMGIDIWMVTGDNRTTAHAIADELDIPRDRVIAGAMPAEKLAKVEELQASGYRVAMIGDGINDSPALARANLGIAIGAGTQVAIEAADLVLVRSNLFDVVVALDLSKKVFAKIRWNFMWAVVYNIIAIPFAAGASFPWTHTAVPPQYAGLSMALSSVSVVLSSLSLKFYRRPSPPDGDSSVLDVTYGETSTESLGVQNSGSIFESAKRNFNRIRDVLKTRRGEADNYSKLTTEDMDDNTLGLELGLGTSALGFGGLKKTKSEDSYDELNQLL